MRPNGMLPPLLLELPLIQIQDYLWLKPVSSAVRTVITGLVPNGLPRNNGLALLEQVPGITLSVRRT